MWTLRIVVLFAACCVKIRWSHEDDHSSIHEVYEKLAILSRITNAVALQSAAIHKKSEIRSVITEILGANKGLFDDLVSENPENWIPALEETLKNSKLAEPKLAGKEAELAELKENNLKLKLIIGYFEYSKPSVIKFLETAKNGNLKKEFYICSKELTDDLSKFSKIMNNEEKTILDVDKLKIIQNVVVKNSKEIIDCLENLMNFKGKTKNFLEDFNHFEFLKKAANKTIWFYRSSFDFSEYFLKIQTFSKLVQGVSRAKRSEDKKLNVGGKVLEILKILKNIQTGRKSAEHIQTAGFYEKGAISKVQEDLRDPWFLESIAKNKKDKVETLEKSLNQFFEFSKMMVLLEHHWEDFMNGTIGNSTALKIQKIGRFFNVKNLGIQGFQGIGKLEDPNGVANDKDLSEFLTSTIHPIQMAKEVEKAKTWIRQLGEKINIPTVQNILSENSKLLEAEIQNKNFNETLQIIQKIEGIDLLLEFGEEFSKLNDFREKFDDGFEKIKNEKILEKAKFAMNFLDTISLRDIVRNLRTKNFDAEKIERMLEFLETIQLVARFQKTEVEELRGFLERFLKVRKEILDLEGFIKKIENNFNDSKTNPILKLKKPLEISISIGRGAQMMHNLSIAHQKKNVFLEVSRFEEGVKHSLLRSPDRKMVGFFQDPESFIQRFIGSLEILDRFGKTALGNGDFGILDFKKIFEESKKIEGFENFFGKAHELLASYHFKDSKKLANIKSCEELKDLELYFVAHRGYLTAASVGIDSLKDYFDEIFELKEKGPKKKKLIKNAYFLVFIISISLIILIGGGVLVGYGFTKNGKAKYKKWYLYYFGKPEDFEKRWRYSLFLDRQDGKNALVDAAREINPANVLKAVKKGAYINVYSKYGNTPLHVATKRAYPEIVDILIRHGADRTLLNASNKTPEQLIPPNYRETHKEKIERFEKVEKIFEKYRNKKFRIQVPEVFPVSSFHIFMESRTNDEVTNKFTEKFQSITSEEILPTTTHCVVKTDEAGLLETDDIKLLQFIFIGVIIVKETWMSECLKDESLISKDADFLVTQIKYNGILYDTVIEWTTSLAKGNLGYLNGVHVAVVIPAYQQIGILSTIVTANGGVMLDKFPEKENYNVGAHPYLHAHLGPLFLIHDGTADLNVYKDDPDKMYTLFTEKEFFAFMLKRDIKVNSVPDPIQVAVDQTIE